MKNTTKLSWVDSQLRNSSEATKFCVKCDKEKTLNKFPMRTRDGKLYINSVCTACVGTMARAKSKLKLFAAFGGKCSCCGENHPYFLTLEHVQGTDHYKKKQTHRGMVVTKCSVQLVNEAEKDGWDRTKYDLLCINCNWAKGKFGICPHRSGLTAEQVLESLRRDAAGIGTQYRRTRDTAKRVDEVLKGIENATLAE